MEKFIILLLAGIVLISACIQPTGKVTQEPIRQNMSQEIQQNISQPTEELQKTEQLKQADFRCEGAAGCYSGNVTRIIDGDTIEVDGVRIRLVLVDAPEPSQVGGFEATNFIHQSCPISSQVTLDQDDRQLNDNYGRMLAIVWCQNKKLNEEIIAQGYASIYYVFCSQSEFGDDDWATKLGCPQPTAETPNCHPSYPTVCIPPPPPDLDCSDVPYKIFEVLSPDPHRFDGDKDGIGCETGP